MIELLLQAERALAMGLVDQAERLYAQAVAADPRNSIAVVGLARVALERTDDAEAYRRAREALAIDPENAAAARLAGRLEEVYATRGLPVPGIGATSAVPPGIGATPAVPSAVPPGDPPDPDHAPAPAATAAPAPMLEPAPPIAPVPAAEAERRSPAGRSLVDRLLRRNRP